MPIRQPFSVTHEMPAPVEWDMPHVERGDLIFFYRAPGDPSSMPGQVADVGPRAIDVILAHGEPVDGVRHIDDPDVYNRPHVIEDSGVFELAGPSKRLAEMQETVTALTAAVEEITAELNRQKQPKPVRRPVGSEPEAGG